MAVHRRYINLFMENLEDIALGGLSITVWLSPSHPPIISVLSTDLPGVQSTIQCTLTAVRHSDMTAHTTGAFHTTTAYMNGVKVRSASTVAIERVD